MTNARIDIDTRPRLRLGAILGATTALAGCNAAPPTPVLPPGDTSRGASNFYVSDAVTVQRVSFRNQYVVPEAGHVDLYDRVELIPFDRLTTFFRSSLR